ncbi:hypothetical protein R1sor_001983 [Riccia sorocarpa]|uniref:Uncharacterized protein n=1 Tax=Riccia sorocarpa TaxID=122646 RepID=A0ABD3GZ50_9MARC
MDLSTMGMKTSVDFSLNNECRKVVPPSEIEVQFLKHTSQAEEQEKAVYPENETLQQEYAKGKAEREAKNNELS